MSTWWPLATGDTFRTVHDANGPAGRLQADTLDTFREGTGLFYRSSSTLLRRLDRQLDRQSWTVHLRSTIFDLGRVRGYGGPGMFRMAA